MSYSLNNMAAKIVEEEIIPNAEALNVDVFRLSNGATVIDMGVKAKGGWKAAKLFTDTCMGGMGELVYQSMYVGNHIIPTVSIQIDRPDVTQLGAHIAGLYVPYHGRYQPVSGPLRAITGTDHWAERVTYRDTEAKKAVGHLQITTLPDEELAETICQRINMDPKDLYLIPSATSTVVGSVQIVARNLEQTFATLGDHLDFPINSIVQGIGFAPVISIEDDEIVAMGRVNDGLIYGQESTVYIDCEDDDILRFADKLPMCKNDTVFGIPFEEMFRESGCDWAKVPRDWDAPCKINFLNIRTNHFFPIGMLHYGVLERDFMGY